MKKRLYYYITFSTLCIASIIYADAGIPMIVITVPLMLLALLPIVLIEAYILFKKLFVSKKIAWLSALISNLFSTLIGIPLTWLVLVMLQMISGGGGSYDFYPWIKKVLSVTWQAPWLLPDENSLYWMIPIATMVLLVPFFFASYFIEYGVTKLLFKIMKINIPITQLKNAVFYGNVLTYIFLEIVVFGYLLYSIF